LDGFSLILSVKTRLPDGQVFRIRVIRVLFSLQNDFLAIEKILFKKQITLVQKIPAGNNPIFPKFDNKLSF
jgi:hypothetical protein